MKSAVLLLAIVAGAAVMGGWASENLIRQWMTQNQTDEAGRLANTLRVMASGPLTTGERAPLQEAVNEFLLHESVLAVAVLGASGERLAFAGQQDTPQTPLAPADSAVELAYTDAVAGDRLLVGRPIVSIVDGEQRIVGAVRIAMDTRMGADRLQQAQMMMGLLICVFVLCFLPLSHTLVLRVLVRPIQRLAQVTGRLADGDYAARAEAADNDEIGLLADGFNRMAEKIEAQHTQLRQANETLEEQVRRRTAALDAANAKLRADMADREEFLRAVSHDLNAPLRNIGGMASMVLMKWADQLPEPVVARLKRIEANVEAETSMINDLLELSRIGTRPSRPEWVDAGEVAEAVRSSFDFDLRDKGVELRIAADAPTLFIERGHLRQVLMNFVDNAVKYIGDGDRIEIGCDVDEEHYVFRVADNGVGIAPDDHKRIFTIFRRARETASAPGKGVGLASVSAIAARYDGRAWVESEPGAGSTFYVSFARRCCQAPTEDDAADDIFTPDQPVACGAAG